MYCDKFMPLLTLDMKYIVRKGVVIVNIFEFEFSIEIHIFKSQSK